MQFISQTRSWLLVRFALFNIRVVGRNRKCNDAYIQLLVKRHEEGIENGLDLLATQEQARGEA